MTNEPTPPALADDLAALAVKATPGPWGIWFEPINGQADKAIQELIEQVHGTAPIGDSLVMLDADGKCPAVTGCGSNSADNAALIVALRNNLPAIIAALNASGLASEVLTPRDEITTARACMIATAEGLATATKGIARKDEALGEIASLANQDGINEYARCPDCTGLEQIARAALTGGQPAQTPLQRMTALDDELGLSDIEACRPAMSEAEIVEMVARVLDEAGLVDPEWVDATKCATTVLTALRNAGLIGEAR